MVHLCEWKALSANMWAFTVPKLGFWKVGDLGSCTPTRSKPSVWWFLCSHSLGISCVFCTRARALSHMKQLANTPNNLTLAYTVLLLTSGLHIQASAEVLLDRYWMAKNAKSIQKSDGEKEHLSKPIHTSKAEQAKKKKKKGKKSLKPPEYWKSHI